MARRFAFLRIVFGLTELKPKHAKETAMPEEVTTLVVQPSKQPTRKVRFAGIAAAFLVVATYVLSTVSGNEPLISEDAALDALRTLGATFAPLVVAWFTKSASTEAGE